MPVPLAVFALILCCAAVGTAEQHIGLPTSLPHSEVNRTFTHHNQRSRSFKTKLDYASARKAIESHLGKGWQRQNSPQPNATSGSPVQGADRYLNPAYPKQRVSIIMIEHQVPTGVALPYPHMVTISVGPSPAADAKESE